MMIFKKAIPRRMFLQGLGATVALPLLEGMIPAFAPKGYAATLAPRRIAFIYMPNGRIMKNWLPKTEGAGYEMTPTLAPLAAFRDDLLVLSGLSVKAAYPEGGHARSCAAFLTGIRMEPKGGLGVSADQVIAKALGTDTQFTSLEFGLDSTNGVGTADGQYAAYIMQTVSWKGPNTPLPIEFNPRSMFERMFGDSDNSDPVAQLRRVKEDHSVLDAVKEGADSLMREVGAGDRSKLTEFMDATRDIERRIQVAEASSASVKTSSSPQGKVFERPVGVPATYAEHIQMLFDLQVLAYQTNLTRVTTFMMGHEQTDRAYREIGISDGHHALSHHREVPQVVEQVAQIDAYQSKMIAYFLDKMKTTQDGEGSLLDHSIVVCGSALSDGNLHLCQDVPVLVAGKGNGKIQGGRHLRFPAPDTPLSNLHLTIMDMMGVPLEAFTSDHHTDATGELEPLTV
jgi:hypothetical protein